jgi:hypothetical protein
MMKNLGGEIIEKSDSVYVVQMNNRWCIGYMYEVALYICYTAEVTLGSA